MSASRYTAYYNTASRVLGELYKLVRLGVISKAIYRNLTKSSVKKQRAALRRYKGRMSADQLAQLKSQVREIQKILSNETATHTYRAKDTFAVTSAVNQCTIFSTNAFGKLSDLQTGMANLRYFDAATNALVTADPSGATYQQFIQVKDVVFKIKVRNNYQVPCELRVYGCRPKSDTSISTSTYFTDGMTDQLNPSANSTLIYPTDSNILKAMWSIKKSCNKTLQPGQETSLTVSIPDFEYDPSLFDTHTTTFMPRYNGFNWLIRLQGVLGHDSIASQYGTLEAGVDCEITAKYVFHYDAGKDLDDITINDLSDSFTNGGVVSSKPVSDNLSYSVA